MNGWIESVIRISLSRYTIRVWRDESDDYEHTPGRFTDIESVARANEDEPPADLAKKIAALPNVVAVEVLDWDHGGVMFYADWPEL
jgi:hypothetical protein